MALKGSLVISDLPVGRRADRQGLSALPVLEEHFMQELAICLLMEALKKYCTLMHSIVLKLAHHSFPPAPEISTACLQLLSCRYSHCRQISPTIVLVTLKQHLGIRVKCLIRATRGFLKISTPIL